MFTIVSILVACSGPNVETPPVTPVTPVVIETVTPESATTPATSETVVPTTEVTTEQPIVVVVAK